MSSRRDLPGWWLTPLSLGRSADRLDIRLPGASKVGTRTAVIVLLGLPRCEYRKHGWETGEDECERK